MFTRHILAGWAARRSGYSCKALRQSRELRPSRCKGSRKHASHAERLGILLRKEDCAGSGAASGPLQSSLQIALALARSSCFALASRRDNEPCTGRNHRTNRYRRVCVVSRATCRRREAQRAAQSSPATSVDPPCTPPTQRLSPAPRAAKRRMTQSALARPRA